MKYTNTNGGATSFADEAVYYYDLAGRMTRLDDWMWPAESDGHYFEYDKVGRMTRYRDFDDDPSGTRQTLDYVYDDNGRVLTMTDYDGYDTYYTYTARGQVSTITVPRDSPNPDLLWDFDYNALGQRTQYAHPNGMVTAYEYDGQNRLTTIRHKDGGTTVLGWDYSLDGDGNILRMASNVSSSGQAWDYGYDGRDRLTSALQLNEAGLPRHWFEYEYDAGDNMLTKERKVYDLLLEDDFTDGDLDTYPDWAWHSSWSNTGGVLTKTAQSGNSEVNISVDHDDGVYSFSYRRETIGTGDPALQFKFRHTNSSDDHLRLLIFAGEVKLDKVVSSTATTLDSDANVSSPLGDEFDVRIVMEGDNVQVWRGPAGEPLSLVLETASASVTSGNRLEIVAGDNLTVEVDDLSLVEERTSDASVTDDFSDGDYTSNPTWTTTGTWSASGNHMANTAHPTAKVEFRHDVDYTVRCWTSITASPARARTTT